MTKAQSFFRAVNLREDIENPPHLSHYHPTGRSLPVVEAVLGRDPTLVIAAYGSGKSLAAGIGALLVRNDARSQHALGRFMTHLKRVDLDLHKRLTERLSSKSKGKVLVLSGHVPDLAREIARLADAPANLKSLDQVLKWLVAERGRTDHVTIIWDEFGRHLESLVAEGRSRDLDYVQRLAEWAARSEKPTASLTLLLHQNLLAYAGALNPTSRNEWRKIEGRFRQLRFVEDSRELYGLVAASIAGRRGAAVKDSEIRGLDAIAQGAVAAGWFDGATEVGEVKELIRSAWPVSAGALQVLPRLVARIGQNERSLFSFLATADLSKPVGFEELYAEFTEAMRSDIGVGGTHRRWIETESARSKTEDAVEREALAAACLLQLGTDGERRKLGRKTLEAAVASRGITNAKASEAVDALIKRKLLLHRRVNDDVSVWHGVDVDVAGRLAEERTRRADEFDVVAFLNDKLPAPIVRASRHNASFGTSRYLSGRFVTTDSLAQPELLSELGSAEWGQALYVLAETDADIAKSKRTARAIEQPRTLLVIPSQPLPAVDVALELACLEALRADESLLAEDPLVALEIDELMAVARRQLATVLHRLTSDRPSTAKWYHKGAPLPVDPERPASIAVSALMDDWFPDTPHIANDQLMRQRVSKQMNTARVRLLTRLMESATKPWLGYGETDTSVESSVYRTVLEQTGLHRERQGEWGFAQPDELKDRGLRRVWEALEAFFTKKSSKPKRLSDLVRRLAGTPIGVPSGVMPILVMAGYRAFARNVSLYSDGDYVPDILGFDANRMFAEPERHEVEIHDAGPQTLRYLSELAYVFTHEQPCQTDEALRFVYDAFGKWRASLPEGARRSRRLSEKAKNLMHVLVDTGQPAEFFLRRLPDIFDKGRGDLDTVITAIERVRNDIDSIVEGYVDEAVGILGEAFRVGGGNDGAVAAIQSWVACLDIDDLMRRDDLRLTDKAILRTARDTINGRYTPQSLARTISAILLQRGFEQWQDSTGGQYAMLVRECRTRIEDASLADGRPSRRLEPIIRNRIDALEAMLARLQEPDGRQAAAGGER
jgi:hypothetical protein